MRSPGPGGDHHDDHHHHHHDHVADDHDDHHVADEHDDAPADRTYNVVDTDVIVSGQERTLEANCRAGDRLVSYSYEVASPTGSNTSRSVNVSTTGTGARVTYRVVGTVANPTATLTVVCRAAA